jgi:hypothetical protein
MDDRDLPALYRSADKLSLKAQHHFFQALSVHLLLLLAAAIMSIINSTKAEAAIVQTLALLGALFCSIYLAVRRPDRLWYSTRALAESIKTMSWRYVSRAEPFDASDDIARAEFRNKLRSAVEQNRDVVKALTEYLTEEQISKKLNQLRTRSLQERLEAYRQGRVNNQLTWYAGKARFNRTASRWAFGGLIAVNALAVVFAIAKVQFPTASYWPTDAFVTLAACVLTWIQAKRFSELAASYSLAAHEISLVRESMSEVKTEKAFSDFVGDAENAFSREHTQWVARKDV